MAVSFGDEPSSQPDPQPPSDRYNFVHRLTGEIQPLISRRAPDPEVSAPLTADQFVALGKARELLSRVQFGMLTVTTGWGRDHPAVGHVAKYAGLLTRQLDPLDKRRPESDVAKLDADVQAGYAAVYEAVAARQASHAAFLEFAALELGDERCQLLLAAFGGRNSSGRLEHENAALDEILVAAESARVVDGVDPGVIAVPQRDSARIELLEFARELVLPETSSLIVDATAARNLPTTHRPRVSLAQRVGRSMQTERRTITRGLT